MAKTTKPAYEKAKPICRITVEEPRTRVRSCPVVVEVSQCDAFVEIMAYDQNSRGFCKELSEDTIRALHAATEDAIKHIERQNREEARQLVRIVS